MRTVLVRDLDLDSVQINATPEKPTFRRIITKQLERATTRAIINSSPLLFARPIRSLFVSSLPVTVGLRQWSTFALKSAMPGLPYTRNRIRMLATPDPPIWG